jgi:hypothetical protein
MVTVKYKFHFYLRVKIVEPNYFNMLFPCATKNNWFQSLMVKQRKISSFLGCSKCITSLITFVLSVEFVEITFETNCKVCVLVYEGAYW